VTCEDHNIIGGLGSAVAEVLSELALVPLRRIGIADVIGTSGEPDELARHYGLDADSVHDQVLSMVRELML
jgi:transketolase